MAMVADRPEKWARGAIRIFGEIVTAREITERLGIAPTEAHEKGEQIRTRSARAATWTTAVWLLDSGLPTTSPIESHVEALLDKLEDHGEDLRQLSKEGCVSELFLGFASISGQGGFTLEHALTVRLAKLPVDLTLDLHSWEG